ncbi:MAG: hypothetical protein BWY32_01002 [bacterium ADurb.Bin243]|nr:MAG: hypothetical protein BWY32_01002 [bacterium ADurb.Bin243]HOD42502.1 hypothetical protein [Candidatus Wallbacteria bacterium]
MQIKRIKRFDYGISRLTVMLFMFMFMAAALGGLAAVMKYSKGASFEELFSMERLKKLFIQHKPLITAEEASKIKTIVSRESGGMEISPSSVNQSAGKDAGSGKKTKADEIILRNNDILTGEIINEKIAIDTEHGVINFKFCDIIAAYSVYETDRPYDKIISKNGDKVSGKIAEGFISLRTASGDTVKVAVNKIKIINKNIDRAN